MKKFFIFVICCVAAFGSVKAQDNRSKPMSFYIVKDPTFADEVQMFVRDSVARWQKKGRFETSDAYRERVTEAKRDAMIPELTQYAIANLLSDYVDKDPVFDNLVLENYDADNSTWLVNAGKFGRLVVPVPIEKAPAFERNWKIDKEHIELYVDGNDVKLKRVPFVSNGETFWYDNSKEANFVMANYSIHFNPIEVDMPSQSGNMNVAQSKIVESSVQLGRSDVDLKVPVTNTRNDNTFVLIVANQDYQHENKINTALNDARVMKEYCEKTLGISEKHIYMYENQSWKNMNNSIENFAKTMQLNQGAKFLVFYFGHGMASPDPNVEDAYMLPIDGSSQQLVRDGISRNNMIESFAKQNPTQLVIYMESCFSGSTNTGEMLAYSRNSSGVRLTPKATPFRGNIILLSASSNAETANAYPEQGHNVFTYEFLKELQRTKGEGTLGEIFANVQLNTARTANNELGGKQQTPTFQTSTTMGDAWKSWTLK